MKPDGDRPVLFSFVVDDMNAECQPTEAAPSFEQGLQNPHPAALLHLINPSLLFLLFLVHDFL